MYPTAMPRTIATRMYAAMGIFLRTVIVLRNEPSCATTAPSRDHLPRGRDEVLRKKATSPPLILLPSTSGHAPAGAAHQRNTTPSIGPLNVRSATGCPDFMSYFR